MESLLLLATGTSAELLSPASTRGLAMAIFEGIGRGCGSVSATAPPGFAALGLSVTTVLLVAEIESGAGVKVGIGVAAVVVGAGTAASDGRVALECEVCHQKPPAPKTQRAASATKAGRRRDLFCSRDFARSGSEGPESFTSGVEVRIGKVLGTGSGTDACPAVSAGVGS